MHSWALQNSGANSPAGRYVFGMAVTPSLRRGWNLAKRFLPSRSCQMQSAQYSGRYLTLPATLDIRQFPSLGRGWNQQNDSYQAGAAKCNLRNTQDVINRLVDQNSVARHRSAAGPWASIVHPRTREWLESHRRRLAPVEFLHGQDQRGTEMTVAPRLNAAVRPFRAPGQRESRSRSMSEDQCPL